MDFMRSSKGNCIENPRHSNTSMNFMRSSMGDSFENTRLSNTPTESPRYSDVFGRMSPTDSAPAHGPHDMIPAHGPREMIPAHGPHEISEQKAKARDLAPVDGSPDEHEQKTEALTPERNSRQTGREERPTAGTRRFDF